MIKAIFFDLDGTLLPMNIDTFRKGYFKSLSDALAPLGLSQNEFISAMLVGVKDMYHNDGTVTNKEVFWNSFKGATGVELEPFIRESDAFYEEEFHKSRVFAGENPLAKKAVELARQGGRKVVLATNPLFPLAAQTARLSWVGLEAEDFDLITDYASDSFTKPNPKYYLSICERVGVEPSECLMIGNDVLEDMMGASQAGLSCYLVTDDVIESDKFEWDGPSGSFAEMIEYISKL